MYAYQVAHGRYFLHEHPLTATSWREDCINDIQKLPGVGVRTCHQCQLGAETATAARGSPAHAPIRKATRFMSNSDSILNELDRRCSGKAGQCSRRGGGQHAQCMGKTARMAAIYPFRLCAAILQGLNKQLVRDGIIVPGSIGLHMVEEVEDIPLMVLSMRMSDDVRAIGGCSSVTRGERHILSIGAAGGKKYIDDLTGIELDGNLVRAAIEKELGYFNDKEVWSLVPTAEAKKETGKPPISVRWVHTNKGDDVHPNMRARLVAREMRNAGDEAIFAPTPPLETLRTVLSLATTRLPGQKPLCRDPTSERRVQISLVDISRAYFNAKIDQRYPTFVELPLEHPDLGKGLCGRLLRHMYGTRHAAQGWRRSARIRCLLFGLRKGVLAHAYSIMASVSCIAPSMAMTSQLPGASKTLTGLRRPCPNIMNSPRVAASDRERQTASKASSSIGSFGGPRKALSTRQTPPGRTPLRKDWVRRRS